MTRRITREVFAAPVVVDQIQRTAIAANLTPCGSHPFRPRRGRPTDYRVECIVRTVLERGPNVFEVIARAGDCPALPLEHASIRYGRPRWTTRRTTWWTT